MATVIGPTPPGTGVMLPAISFTAAKSTSPASLPSAIRLTPDVDDAGTGFDHAGRDEFRAADRGDQDVRLPRHRREIRVFEWQMVTVASFCKSSSASGLPTMVERPTMTALLAGERHAGVLEQPHHAGRGAGHEAGAPLQQRAQVDGVKAVDILGGRNRGENPVRVELPRQRQLHQDAVHRADRRSAARCIQAARFRKRRPEIRGLRNARRFPRRRAPCCARRRARPDRCRRGSRRARAARRGRRVIRSRFFATRAPRRRAIFRR